MRDLVDLHAWETPNTILNNYMNLLSCYMKEDRFAASPFGARGMISARCDYVRKHTRTRSPDLMSHAEDGIHPANPLPVDTFSVLNAPSMLALEDGQEREKSEEETLHTVSANRDLAQQCRI